MSSTWLVNQQLQEERLGLFCGWEAVEVQTSKSNIRREIRRQNSKKVFILETSRMTERVNSFTWMLLPKHPPRHPTGLQLDLKISNVRDL